MSEQGLFRVNAVKQQAAKLDGDVIIAQPLSSSVLTLVLLLLVAMFVSFLALSSFHRKETVTGYLKPDLGLAKVSSPRPGIVSQLFVEDGQQVEAGMPLALIHIPEHLADGLSLTQSLFQGLLQQAELLSLRQQQLSQQFAQQETELNSRLLLSQSMLQELKGQQQLQQERLVLQQSRYQNYQQLQQQGAISELELQQQAELILGIRQQLAELSAARQQQQGSIEQLQGQLARLPVEQAQQLALLDTDRSRLEQQKIELDACGQLLITAPIKGRVTNLVADIGSTVQSQLPLLTILPDNAELTAVLLVPTRAFGFVQPGQHTRIRFDAFPYQRFGLYEGEVIRTAKAIVLPGEVDMPVAVQEPVYRVEVALAAQEIRAYGNSVPLQSGMLLSADIVLEHPACSFQQTSELVFEPILSLKGQL